MATFGHISFFFSLCLAVDDSDFEYFCIFFLIVAIISISFLQLRYAVRSYIVRLLIDPRQIWLAKQDMENVLYLFSKERTTDRLT